MSEIQQIDPFWGVKTLEFVTALQAVNTCTEVMDLFGRQLAEVGFKSYIMLTIDKREMTRRIIANGWHPEWTAIYTEENLAGTDPVRRELMQGTKPFFWSEVPYNAEQEPRAKLVMDLAAELRMKEGFGLPIADGNIAAAISAAGEKPDLGHGVKAALHVMSLFTYNRFRALIKPPSPSAQTVLTEREREALRWVSFGKTDCDISDILKVSERTVRAHVLSAVHKLKAANRTAAVAVALSNGVLPLNY